MKHKGDPERAARKQRRRAVQDAVRDRYAGWDAHKKNSKRSGDIPASLSGPATKAAALGMRPAKTIFGAPERVTARGRRNAAEDLPLRPWMIKRPSAPGVVDSADRAVVEHEAARAALPGISGTQTGIESGFVYVMVSPAYPGYVKIGSAVDHEVRLATYQTGTPFRDYRMIHIALVGDRRAAEVSALLRCPGRVGNSEWFRCSVAAAVKVVSEVKHQMNNGPDAGGPAGCL